MSDILLTHVASLLSYSSSCQNVGDKCGETCPSSSGGQNTMDSTANGKNSFCCESISYPSLSLTHPPVEAGATIESPIASPLREAIRVKASAYMSQPVKVQPATGLCFKEIARHMLENILDSFDQLVDARIRQYSKVLSNHGLSLRSASGRADIVEYKLRTLLEIGTNISFGSISVKFESTTTNMDVATTSTEMLATIPVMLTVEIDSLQFHPPNHSCPNKNNSSSKHHRNHLTFHAPGRIHGICSANHDDSTTFSRRTSDDASSSSTSICFKNLVVEVDCEALLKEMMEEAGEVVGMVVELTNEAWAERQEHMARLKNEATSSSSSIMNEDSPKLSSPSVRETETSTSATLMESTKSATGQKLGVVKTVSELELSLPEPTTTTTTTTTTTSQEGIDQDTAANDDWHWKQCFSAGDDSLVASPLLSRDSDEENTNPGISAEKASHIIDYVFDEIDDGLIPSSLPRALQEGSS